MAQDKNKEPKYPWTEEEKIDFASEIKKLEVWKNVQSRIQEQYNKEQRQEISSSLLIGIINRDEEKYNKFQKIVGKEIFHTLLKVQEEYQRLNNAIKRILEDKEDEKEKQETLNSMSLGRSDFCEMLCNRYKILDTSELSHEEAFKKFAEWVEMYLQKNHPNKKSINKIIKALYVESNWAIEKILNDLFDEKILMNVRKRINNIGWEDQTPFYSLLENFINYYVLNSNNLAPKLILSEMNEDLMNLLYDLDDQSHYSDYDDYDDEED